MYDTYNTVKTTFETKKTAYNLLRVAYNTAQAAEEARLADLFKALFDPAVVVPDRPCPPDQPADWTGIDFKSVMTGTGNTLAEWTAANKAAKWGTLYLNKGVQSVAATYKLGYQMVTADTTTTTVASTGHIYGLLGQGDLMIDPTTLAFQWTNEVAAKKHFMMVSILPYLDTMSALTASEKIVLDFKTHAFDTTWKAIVKPTRPTAAEATITIGSSTLIAASTIALATVASSLF